ncbi:TonB-dependent receptor plug domain-containing protein [bacterium]|nr:TonB-dependent receptor plug domain-containing protein [bacterium]
MKYLICISWLLLCHANAKAQTIYVFDNETKLPLENVVLQFKISGQSYTSNSLGIINLDSNVKASDTATFQLLGYKMYRISLAQLKYQNYKVVLYRLSFSLEHVVIVANRWQQPFDQVVQQSVEITAEAIAHNNPQTAADMLGQSGAVFIQKSQQGGGSPMIRGFATNRLLISVDGVRMNNAIFRSGNLQNVISIDPFSLAKTEVLFGPASLMHGSDAIGGVMAFYTQNPVFSNQDSLVMQGNLSLRSATANKEQTAHLQLNFGNKKLAGLTSYSYNNFQDLKMGKNGPADYLRTFSVKRINGKDSMLANPQPLLQLNTGYRQHNFLQKLSYKIGQNSLLSYALHFSTTGNYDRYDRLIRTKNNLPRSAEWYYGPQRWQMHHLSFSSKTASKWCDEMNLHLALQKFDESRYDRDFGKSTLNERIEQVAAYSLNADFKKNIGEKSTLLYGMEWVYNKVRSSGYSFDIETQLREAGPARYPGAYWNSDALYLNFEKQLKKDLHLEAGLRYNIYALQAQFDTTFYPLPFTRAHLQHAALTGSAGISYTASERLKMSAAISTGFRSPNVDDLGKIFDSEPGAVVVPNPNLKAEYLYNGSVGMAAIVHRNVKCEVNTFYSYLNRAMVRRDFQLNGLDSIEYSGEMSKVQAIQNAAYATVYGVQASVEAEPVRNLKFLTTVSFQKGFEILDNGNKDRLRHAAPLFGKTSLSYLYHNFEWMFYAYYNGGFTAAKLPVEEAGKDYLYAKDAEGKPYAPAWHTFNSRMSYAYKKVLLEVAVENILNLRYRTYSSGIAAAGRNLIVSCRVAF